MPCEERYVCTICNSFASTSFRAVFRHMSDHRCDPGLHIVCGINSCNEMYKNYDSYRTHVYRKHRETLLSIPRQELSIGHGSNSAHSSPTQEEIEEIEEPSAVENPTSEDPFHTPTSPILISKRSAALFLLKTREERKVTQTALNGIVQDLSGILKDALEGLKEKIERISEHSGDVQDVLKLVSNTTLPFDGLETQYSQRKYYKQHFNLLEPQERVLGQRQEVLNGRTVDVKDCCYDIPLLGSLRALLRSDIVREQVLNSHKALDGMLADFCDGEQFKSSPLFKDDPCALQIQLYYDELEVCNPLGSKAKKHKLGLVYYTLGNLHPELRSSLKSIQLLCAVKYSFVVKYGLNEIFKPVVEAILELEKENGVNFHLSDSTDIRLRGTITSFSADNLAAWAIGGFKALASAFRKCQYCMAVDEDMQSKFLESEFQLRTKLVYKSHCEALGGPHHSHISTTYGMSSDSVLNRCEYFHVTEGIVPDIMHDILEGTLELCMRHLLIHYIREDKLFSVDVLNARITSFKYGVDVRNKPTTITPVGLDSHLKQSATQMWCLGRSLPFLIGEFIPEDDSYWDNFLALLTITDFVFAPTTTAQKADFLTMEIEDFLVSFRELYPNRKLTPKMHYMIHLPSWMKRCGPLSRVWCMRYEAKHSYFKQVANVLGNFKNIAKTLSDHHQHYMCYQLSAPARYLRCHQQYPKGSPVTCTQLPYSKFGVEWFCEVKLCI